MRHFEDLTILTKNGKIIIDMDGDRLLAKVCYLYYEKGLKQEDVAKQVGKSVMSISRLLREAKERRLVEIRVNLPYPHLDSLEKKLGERFPTTPEFLVLDSSCFGNSEFKAALGRAASFYITFFIKNRDYVGVGGGKTLAYLVSSLPRMTNLAGTKVVQLSGMLQPDIVPENPAVIAQQLCYKLGGDGYFYAMPSFRMERKILNDNFPLKLIHDALKKQWSKLTIGLVGIGELNTTLTSLRLGYITKDDFIRLKKNEAVGDILLHFYGLNGKIVDEEFDRTVTGISWAELKNIPRLIAIAGGQEKIAAIYGAIQSGILDLLITDDQTAKMILNKYGRG